MSARLILAIILGAAAAIASVRLITPKIEMEYSAEIGGAVGGAIGAVIGQTLASRTKGKKKKKD